MIIAQPAGQQPVRSRATGIRLLVLCALILTVWGCSTSLKVDSPFPRPLVASLPIDVGVYYDASLRQYAFEQEADADSLAWDIEIGQAHVRLFDQLFHPLFENLIEVDSLRSGSATRSAKVIIKPSINKYTLQTPGDTATGFYEVEIQYTLAFYSPSGDFINRWTYSGRGKSRSELLSTENPVQKATVAAMRDAAAWLVIELTKHPDFHTRRQAQQSDNANGRQDHDS